MMNLAALASTLTLGRLPSIADLQKESKAESIALTDRYDVPKVLSDGKTPVPADLRDVKGRFYRTPDGFRIAGRLLDGSLNLGAPSPARPFLFASLPILTALLLLCRGVPVFMAPILAAIVADLLLIFFSTPWQWAASAMIFGVIFPYVGVPFFQAGGRELLGSLGAGGGQGIMLFSVPMLVLCSALSLGLLFQPTRRLTRLVLCIVGYALVAVIVAGFLPRSLQPIVAFAGSIALPVVFAHGEFRDYVRLLVLQGQLATLESSGPVLGHLAARQVQADRVAEDTSESIVLGIARGVLTVKMDGFAPDKGLPVRISLNDLRTHLIVFGATGTGKSESIAKPIGWAAIRATNCGLVVMDAKGPLAKVFEGASGYQLVTPGATVVAMIEGLGADDIADTLAATGGRAVETGNGAFFKSSGRMMVRHGFIVLRALIDAEAALGVTKRNWHWTLHDFQSLLQVLRQGTQDDKNTTAAYITTIRGHVPEASNHQSRISDAIAYYQSLASEDAETTSNVYATVKTWLDPLVSNQNPNLGSWACAETGFDVECVLRGGKIGILTPEYDFGSAGRTVQALIKQRIFRGILKRGSRQETWAETETPVLTLADESHDLVTDADTQLIPLGRSLGAMGVYLSQNVEAFEVALGDATRARRFLGDFRSIVSFASTPATAEYVQRRLGTTRNLTWQLDQHGVNFIESAKRIAESPLFDSGQSPSLRRFARVMLRRGAGSVATLGYSQIGEAKGDLKEDGGQRLKMTFAAKGTWKEEPLMSLSDFDANTATPYVAVCEVLRGGVRRRDFISCEKKRRAA